MTVVSTRVVTIPNVLSLLRLLLIPVFLVLVVRGDYGYAVLTLAVSSITDFADGFIARRFDQVTRVGQLLDPIADRLFILSTLLGIALSGIGVMVLIEEAQREENAAGTLRLVV